MVNIYMTLFLRSPRIASRVFGVENPNQLMRAVPKTKFLFFVEFVLSAGGRAMITGNADLNTYIGNRGLSFKVKQIDKPKVMMKTVDLNQYNKKRLAYTTVEYAEASIKLHDTVDESAMATWIDYFTYYFGDSRIKTTLAYGQSPVDPVFTDESGWGFRPLAEDTKFFDKITVYAFYANTYTAFSYINPKITSIDWQMKDYSSSDPEELTINFKYELIEYRAFGLPINRAQLNFGWLPEDELDSTDTTLPDVPKAPLPRIFSQNIINNANKTMFDGDVDIDTESDEVDTPFVNPSTSLDIIDQEPRPGVAPSASVPTVNDPINGNILGGKKYFF